VRIKPETPFRDTGKIIMKRSYGDKDDYKKAYFENSWYKAEFREFGNYELLEDNTPPVIIPAGFHNGMNSHKVKTLRFTVTDNCEEIKSFSGTLDGQWLLFSNDKGKTFIYQRDDKWTVGAHELKIMAEDLAGNKTIKTFNFTE
jgi:hypothetical protein